MSVGLICPHRDGRPGLQCLHDVVESYATAIAFDCNRKGHVLTFDLLTLLNDGHLMTIFARVTKTVIGRMTSERGRVR